MASKLDKAYTVAGEGYNRWLVPTSALMIHLCVGMGYGMSVFCLPQNVTGKLSCVLLCSLFCS